MINNIPSWQSASENYTPVKLAILAPRWLQEALGILLLSEDTFTLVANTQNEDALFLLSSSQMPDIILIDTNRRLNKAVEQITRIKAKIQSANYVMLVDQTSQNRPLTEAGADAVILKGSPPSSILEMIKQVAEKRRIETKGKSKPNTGSLSRKDHPEV
jgi:DNA-binding NarL/FixJ family response regulator